MRICHWNSHHSGIGSDGKFDTLRLAEAIGNLNPDAVTLNEVEQFTGYGNQDSVAIICQHLGPTWAGAFVNVSGVVGGKGQGNAILSKLGPPTNVVGKNLWQGRGMISAVVSGMQIVCSHISNVSASDRAVQMSQVLCSDSVRHVDPMILVGDWNAHKGNTEIAPFYAWYPDAWDVAVTKSSFNGTGATHGSSRIDIAFVRGHKVQSVVVPDTRINGVFPSDHNPIVFTL